MYNIYYIESPLQLLSAIEAKKTFQQEESILIINFGSEERKKNKDQINQLIDSSWGRVIKFRDGMNIIHKLINVYFKYCLTTFNYRGKVNKYFFGDLRSVDMALLNKTLIPRESIMLDDGSYTIVAQSNTFNGIKNKLKSGVKLNLLKSIIDKPRHYNIFSFFDLDGILLNGQKNYYTQKDKVTISIDSDCIYYFGSKFTESGILLEEDEIMILSQIIEPDKNNIYIPHRDESQTKIDKISKIGFKIKQLNCPAEVFFDEVKQMPYKIVSFYSTVLHSCYSKFDNVSVDAINVTEYIQKPELAINVGIIYSYYQGIGINIKNV